MHKSNVHARYSHQLTKEQDGNRSFLLHGGEKLHLSIARPKRYLYLLSGQVMLSLADVSTLLLAADDGDKNPLPVASADPIVVHAHERSNLFDVDAKAVDELHAWDALSDSIDDEVVLRRMEMVRGSETFRALPAESVEEAPRVMSLMDVPASQTIIDQGEECHIPGSRHIALGDLQQRIDEIELDARYIDSPH